MNPGENRIRNVMKEIILELKKWKRNPHQN